MDAEKERSALAEGQREYNERLKTVKADYEFVNDTYGKEFVKKHEAAIVAKMQESEKAGRKLTIPQAAAVVLTPLLRAESTEARKTVMSDLSKRPAAASKTLPAAAKTEEDEGPKTGEDVIHDALRKWRAGRTAA